MRPPRGKPHNNAAEVNQEFESEERMNHAHRDKLFVIYKFNILDSGRLNKFNYSS